MNFRQDAMSKLYPTWAVIDGDTDVKDKDGKTIVIDESEISKEVTKLQAEYDAQAYSRNREAEYPSVQECVHAILDDTLDALQAKRASVKLKYPKGG